VCTIVYILVLFSVRGVCAVCTVNCAQVGKLSLKKIGDL